MIALVLVLGCSFLAIVLVPGLQLASDLAANTATLKFVSQQQRGPALLRVSLDSINDRLAGHGYVQDSLDQLRATHDSLEAAVHAVMTSGTAPWYSRLGKASGRKNEGAGAHAANLQSLWNRERGALGPVLAFRGVPYRDADSTGTVLNDAGQSLERDVSAALRVSKRLVPMLDSELSALVGELQARNEHSAAQLRLVMLTSVFTAMLLAALVTILALARQKQDSSLRQARQQTEDILRTVKDGLFLLDRDLVIGASHSSALEFLFARKDVAGLRLEALLRGIVSEKTLDTALKFVAILWSERTKENLVKSINPLGEVEITVDDGKGRVVTRYLQFDFHRVRAEDKITHILVSVSDVSARVDLARELQASQTQAQGQVDALLSMLHVDPAQLASFLSDSDVSVRMINAILREPAREENAFRKKLDTLFRQVHSVKGEAAALGLSSIESRAHGFEEDLKSLRDKRDLSGNDFLPLVIKLDDLLTHLGSVGELVARLARLHVAAPPPYKDTGVLMQTGPDVAVGMIGMLQNLAVATAAENGKEAGLKCVGFETIPHEYRRVVKDIAVQAVRNAIVHGIEASALRVANGKSGCGALRLVFQDLGESGYKFVAEDDGQGLSTERIKAAALKKGFITPEKAQTLDARQIFTLLFQSGFSTIERSTKEAGRGVGMNLMAGLMQQVGGKVSVATMPGKFTRLTLTLPPLKRVDDTEAA